MKSTRRIALLIAILTLFTVCLPTFVSAEGEASGESVSDDPGITSGNAIVVYSIDRKNVFWSNRLEEKVDPVVANKLVTAMVVMDVINERGFKLANAEAFATAPSLEWGNPFNQRIPYINLAENKTYKVEYLLQAMLVGNAYDAANVLAYHYGENYLGGSIDNFIDKMNEKAKSVGAVNTVFTNATGMPDPNQYTTPHDVALIAAAFYEYNTLVNYTNVSTYGSGSPNKNFLKNGSRIKDYVRDDAIGLIAGQLDVYGNYSLVTAMQNQGKTYVFVVMCATGMNIDRETGIWSLGKGNAYEDAIKLMSWMKDSFELLTIATKDTIVGELRVDFGTESDHVMVVPAEDVEELVLKNISSDITVTVNYDTGLVYQKEFNGKMCDTIVAPVTPGQKVGTVTFSHDGKELATVDAVLKEGVEQDPIRSGMAGIKDFLFGPVMKTVIFIVVGIIVIYIIVVIVMAVIRGVNKSRNLGKKMEYSKENKENSENKPEDKEKTSEKAKKRTKKKAIPSPTKTRPVKTEPQPKEKQDSNGDTKDFGQL